ncbi:MAG: hypothetical protein HC828_06655 [Blastochloris sp.]|nr:hypothetical protein [Blastochloris sp.]
MNKFLWLAFFALFLTLRGIIYAQDSNPIVVSQVDWSLDGRQILVALQQGGLYTIDPYTQDILLDLPPDVTGAISDAALQPSGILIATVDERSTLNIWDSLNGMLVNSLTNISAVWRVEWSPDGQYIFTSNADEMFVRDAAGNPLFTIAYAAEDIPNVAFSPNGELLLLSFSAKIEVWNIASRQMLARHILGGLRQSVEWSRDGNTIMAATVNNTREGTAHNVVVIDPLRGKSCVFTPVFLISSHPPAGVLMKHRF